jgi:S-DNA-T family DNA segregation ATPase FtsK/SpoIIIE
MPDAALTTHRTAAEATARTAAPDGADAALGARWHLAVIAGPDPGWCHPVRRDAQTVGRDPECDLTLADPQLSRLHLEIRERRGVVEARDLGSANGTRARLPYRRFAVSRRRRLSTRWRRLAEGTDLLAGRSVLRLRARPGLDGRPAPGAGATTPVGVGGVDRESTAPRSHLPATTLLLAASSLPVLVASGASGLRLVAFVLVPLALVAATALPRPLRERQRLGPSAPGRSATRRSRAQSWLRGESSLDPGLDPASVLLAASSGVQTGPRPNEPAPLHPGTPAAWRALLPGDRQVDPFSEGPVALVGHPTATAAAARLLTCQLAVRHDRRALGLRLELAPGTDRVAWRWLDRLPHTMAPADAARGGVPPERLLVIRTGDAGAGAPPDRRASPHGAIVVLVQRLEHVPPWCRRVVEAPDDDGLLVSTSWAERVADALAGRETARTARSDDVALAPLLADPLQAWRHHDAGLAAAFVVGQDGPVEIDLARDGPHALVAGTTGSGKSELLLCWVLALACRYPPSALTIVAIDYKGGATFGPLADLPHVADVLTDLDGAGTARALAGLRDELARRERLLAAAGARDLDAYCRARAPERAAATSTPALGRLLVVVDEFRALADEHPELLSGLARLAAQGRSLGIHLVLATQRPAGALSADLRANLRMAICLRVLSAGDSLDVLGSAEAARLPAVPGRAILAGITPAANGDVVQAAWSGIDGVSRAVERVTAAAQAHGQPVAGPLWAPALPTAARADGGSTGSGFEGGLPVALRDVLGRRDLTTWAWSAASPLIIAGGPGTGRTTALQSLATAALHRGWAVHLVHGPADALVTRAGRDITRHAGLGTTVGTADPRRLVRLLDLVLDAPGPALLCIDDIDAVLAACERVGGASGAERLGRILREAATDSLSVAIAGPLDVVGARWAAAARHRLVLGQLDGAQAALAGVPRALLTSRAVPGRGVLLGDGPPTAVQVFLPERPEPGGLPPAAGGRGPARLAAGPAEARPIPRPRLRPIPPAPDPQVLASSADSAPAGRHAVPLGVGGDDAGVVWLDVRPGARVVVAGPPGSGRTNALVWLAARLADLGPPVGLSRASDDRTPDGDRLVNAAPLGDAALLVDDADLLGRSSAERLADLWRGRDGVLIVAVRTQTLTTGYSGLGALLRDARDVVVLAPLRGGPGHLTPGEVLPHADPAAPRTPGRGVLVGALGAVPVQLPHATHGPAHRR